MTEDRRARHEKFKSVPMSCNIAFFTIILAKYTRAMGS